MNTKFYRDIFIQNVAVLLYKICEDPFYAENAAEHLENALSQEFNPYYHLKFVPIYSFEKTITISDDNNFNHNRLSNNNGCLLFELLSPNEQGVFSTAKGLEIWVMDNLKIRVFGAFEIKEYDRKDVEKFKYRYPLKSGEYELTAQFEKLRLDENDFIDAIIAKANKGIKKYYCDRYVCFECPNAGVCE